MMAFSELEVACCGWGAVGAACAAGRIPAAASAVSSDTASAPAAPIAPAVTSLTSTFLTRLSTLLSAAAAAVSFWVLANAAVAAAVAAVAAGPLASCKRHLKDGPPKQVNLRRKEKPNKCVQVSVSYTCSFLPLPQGRTLPVIGEIMSK